MPRSLPSFSPSPPTRRDLLKGAAATAALLPLAGLAFANEPTAPEPAAPAPLLLPFAFLLRALNDGAWPDGHVAVPARLSILNETQRRTARERREPELYAHRALIETVAQLRIGRRWQRAELIWLAHKVTERQFVAMATGTAALHGRATAVLGGALLLERRGPPMRGVPAGVLSDPLTLVHLPRLDMEAPRLPSGAPRLRGITTILWPGEPDLAAVRQALTDTLSG